MRTRTVWGVACTVVLLGLAASGLVAQRQPLPADAEIGAVRPDGVFLPLGAVRGGVWTPLSVLWGTATRTEFTAEGRALPASGWTLSSAAGDARMFSLTKPTTAAFNCSRAQVFDTTLSTPQRLQGEATQTGSRLAIRGRAKIEHPDDLVAHPDADGEKIAELVRSLAAALEAERFDAYARDTPELRALSAAQRSSQPIRVVHLWRHKARVMPWHFFTAERTYPETDVTFSVSGWIAAHGASSIMNEVSAGFGSNQGMDAPPMEMLGIIPEEREQGATWVFAFPTIGDLIFSLVQVGAGPLGESRQELFDVWPDHCNP